MQYSRDSNSPAQATPEATLVAHLMGMRTVWVICYESGAEVPEESAISFVSYSHGIPRQGEQLILDDGRVCRVERVVWKTMSTRGADGKISIITLAPTVMAELTDKKLNVPKPQ